MRHRTPLALAALALLAAACSAENPKPAIGERLPMLLRELGLKKKAAAKPANPLAGLTRAQLAGLPGPLLAAHLEDADAWATLSPIADNRGTVTFATPDQITVALKDGVLVATRGLAGDLIASDSAAAIEAIRKGRRARYSRSLSWLNGEDQTVTVTYSCSLEPGAAEKVEIVERIHDTRLLRETCRSDADGGFSNSYYAGQGVIWTSRQWIGPDAGYLNLTVLIRG